VLSGVAPTWPILATPADSHRRLAQKSLREQLTAPDMLITDFAKFERPGQLHIAFQALHKFVAAKGSLPRARNQVGHFLNALKLLSSGHHRLLHYVTTGYCIINSINVLLHYYR